MRMSSSGGTPRKFSEKIAILERKQNEENNTFEDIMRQVRSITHEPGDGPSTAPMAIPQQGPSSLCPPQQPWGHNLGGSLPNVHQMPSYSTQQQWPWQHEMTHNHRVYHMSNRSRSPEERQIMGVGGHHYHPYGNGRGAHSRSPDRVPPLHPHVSHNYHHQMPQSAGYHHPPQGLVPPESWNQINRARSDPAIHNMGMNHPHPMQFMGSQEMQQHQHYIQNSMPGPSGMMSQQQQQQQQTSQIPSPLQLGNVNQNGMSPLQSPVNHMMHPMQYGYQNGSPMQSPMGSPHASSLMLDGSQTPCMELSPPGMHDFGHQEVGSLPNLMNGGPPQQHQNGGPNYYHAPVGPRHSTGTCGPRLAPGPILTPESQSAPTSPHNQLDPNQQPAWPTRTFSNSPEALDIPKLVLTNAEGTPGQHLECFNDLQDLTLNANDLSLLCNNDQM